MASSISSITHVQVNSSTLPIVDKDAARISYVDSRLSTYLPLSGGTIVDHLNLSCVAGSGQISYTAQDGYFTFDGQDIGVYFTNNGMVYLDSGAYIYLENNAQQEFETGSKQLFRSNSYSSYNSGSYLYTHDFDQISSVAKKTTLRKELDDLSAELSVVKDLNEYLEQILDNSEDLATKTYVNQVSSNIVNKIPTKTSDITNDSGFITSSQKGIANGVATLGSDGKVLSSQLPATSNEFNYIILKDQKSGSTDRYKLCIYDGSLSVFQL